MACKYVILVGDGMGDYPHQSLGNRTPLEVANTPHMDRIAAGNIGLVNTIPKDMDPGSDVANLSILGYDPRLYHPGRAPLEAARYGISLNANDVAFRMNLVCLDFRSQDEIIMVSHSAGDISQKEGESLVEYLRPYLQDEGISIYPGVAYRHLLIWRGGPKGLPNIPPHDFLGRNIAYFLKDNASGLLWEKVRQSWTLLAAHPINQSRILRGLLPANSIWLCGQGNAPRVPRFMELYQKTGAVISAVDLVKGIGAVLGLKVIEVEGATGYLDSNFEGKAQAALEALREVDLVFLHVEAPDEVSHNGDLEKKILAIEVFDSEVVSRVLKGLRDFQEYRVMVISDHLTPIALRTHSPDPTPFAWADRKVLETNISVKFSEERAAQSGLHYFHGHTLMADFLAST